MSKFTEEWQDLKKRMGHMVGVMESMAAKYGECTDLEETYTQKGYQAGLKSGLCKTKAELCAECNHKVLAEQCCQYADVLNLYHKLETDQQMLVSDIILEISRSNGRAK